MRKAASLRKTSHAGIIRIGFEGISQPHFVEHPCFNNQIETLPAQFGKQRRPTSTPERLDEEPVAIAPAPEPQGPGLWRHRRRGAERWLRAHAATREMPRLPPLHRTALQAQGSAPTPAKAQPDIVARRSTNTASPRRADGLDREPRLGSDRRERPRQVLRAAYRARARHIFAFVVQQVAQGRAAAQPPQACLPPFPLHKPRRLQTVFKHRDRLAEVSFAAAARQQRQRLRRLDEIICIRVRPPPLAGSAQPLMRRQHQRHQRGKKRSTRQAQETHSSSRTQR